MENQVAGRIRPAGGQLLIADLDQVGLKLPSKRTKRLQFSHSLLSWVQRRNLIIVHLPGSTVFNTEDFIFILILGILSQSFLT